MGRGPTARIYRFKVGDNAGPSLWMSKWSEIKLYVTGLAMGDGQGLERATLLGETVADTLIDGGQFKHVPIVRLSGGSRPVYAWSEAS